MYRFEFAGETRNGGQRRIRREGRVRTVDGPTGKFGMFEEDLFAVMAAATNDQSMKRKRARERRRLKTQSRRRNSDCSRINGRFGFRSEGVCFVLVHSPEKITKSRKDT